MFSTNASDAQYAKAESEYKVKARELKFLKI